MVTVETVDLRREFSARTGKVVALDGVTLRVEEGEVFGLLGPNGAGKTTLIRILSTLLLPTSGKATVGGYDVADEPEKVRPLINMASGAERAGYDFITARGNLWFFSQLYGIPSEKAHKRINELSAALELGDYLDSKLYALSTGYRQRMTIARAFINDPKVVFMDEPTVGLDVMTARKIREFLARQAKDGKRTIFLATHNMAETDAICDRAAIIDKGKILVCESPEFLKRSLGVPAFVIEVSPAPRSLEPFSSLHGVSGVTSTFDEEREVARVTLLVEAEDVVEGVLSAAKTAGLKVLTTWRQEPTLEEVFVKLVGRGFAEREMELTR